MPTVKQLQCLRAIASQFRRDKDMPADGYVMISANNKATGWLAEPDVTTVALGSYAVPAEGEIRCARGGSDANGARHWEIIKEAALPTTDTKTVNRPIPPELIAAGEAIAHVLNTICDDPKKFYLLGTGTESYRRLTDAHAQIHRLHVEEVRQDFAPNPERYASYLASLESEKQIHDALQKRVAVLDWIKANVGNIDFEVKIPTGVDSTNPWIAVGDNFETAVTEAMKQLAVATSTP